MRTHPSTLELMRRFNLQIYYQLRVQEITRELERSLEDTPEASPGSGGMAGALPGQPDGLKVAAAAAAVRAVSQCFSPAVFLAPLSCRFLRLALQCLSRFDTWLQQQLALPTTSGPAGTAAGSAPANVHYLLYADAQRIIDWLRGELPAVALAALELPSQHDDLQRDCRSTLQDSAAALCASCEKLRQAAVKQLADHCCHVLAQVRTIKAMYCMTNRSMPSSHSFFIPEVMAPLRDFLREHELSLATRQQWALDVSGHVARHYLDVATKMLDEVRESEDALRVLQKRQTPARTDAARATDSDKIGAQLFLDVVAYGKELGELGVDIDGLSAYTSLLSAVRPDDMARN